LKKDLNIPKVEGVGIAIAEEEIKGDTVLRAYLVNFNKFELKNVLISTKGYGLVNEVKKTTSKFSHFLGDINPMDAQAFETISDEVIGLNNEFFLTYYIDGQIYDKKYIFLPESISKSNFIEISVLNKKGVLIK